MVVIRRIGFDIRAGAARSSGITDFDSEKGLASENASPPDEPSTLPTGESINGGRSRQSLSATSFRGRNRTKNRQPEGCLSQAVRKGNPRVAFSAVRSASLDVCSTPPSTQQSGDQAPPAAGKGGSRRGTRRLGGRIQARSSGCIGGRPIGGTGRSVGGRLRVEAGLGGGFWDVVERGDRVVRQRREGPVIRPGAGGRWPRPVAPRSRAALAIGPGTVGIRPPCLGRVERVERALPLLFLPVRSLGAGASPSGREPSPAGRIIAPVVLSDLAELRILMRARRTLASDRQIREELGAGQRRGAQDHRQRQQGRRPAPPRQDRAHPSPRLTRHGTPLGVTDRIGLALQEQASQ